MYDELEHLDVRKHLECLRQRKLRANKKAEKQMLQQTCERLDADLARLRLQPAKATTTNPYRLASALLQQRNQTLRTEVERHRRVAHLLAVWVTSQCPIPQSVAPRVSWMESTLMNHPVARCQGLQWLSDRVFHTAIDAPNPFGSHVEDGVRVQLYTSDDGDDGLSIAGSETHIQHTFFSPSEDVAHVLWAWDRCNAVYASEIADQVDPRLVYYRGNSLTGTNLRRISRMYDDNDANRIVITIALVAEDERYAMGDDELRIHGFAWTMAERVTDSITLVRHSRYHAAPKTKHGVASLDDMARLYLGPRTTEHEPRTTREVTVERIRSAVETIYTRASGLFVQAMLSMLDQHQLEKKASRNGN
ncbi:Aste57867_3142 [Aphanomyces stellatus]|uniref:Aste57867_3142 protein n=1 Tax=Aphanomyces stellatus TaxID=120398 RepID=A0A485K9R2_9STRA|nr:hypothetical protein As57867_003133 [Aphanomyces stellatus]VFT80317.1 Aste57867_3142 [Aphanomyces stellatus]